MTQTPDGQAGGHVEDTTAVVETYYLHSRSELLPYVPEAACRILDCGCGGGQFGRLLKERGAREVVGIELAKPACILAERFLDRVIQADIETMDVPFEDGYFDCICLADILEHLRDPLAVVRRLTRLLASDGMMVMSIPNARYFRVLVMLAQGRWRYEEAGVLDKTHLRFFTAAEMIRMVEDAGLEIVRIRPLSMDTEESLPINPDNSVTVGRVKISLSENRDYQDLLTIQYAIQA